MADLKTCPPLTRESVIDAHALIKPHIHLTPVLTNTTLSTLASLPRDDPSYPQSLTHLLPSPAPARYAQPTLRLYFKCENFQRIGAFKARGAFHAVARLLAHDPSFSPAAGVVTHSSGNHAQALALAARERRIPAHIVMPDVAPQAKVRATQGYGANVVFSGPTAAERMEVAGRVVEETGARMVPPYDHPDIVLGQGTLGLELTEQVKGLLQGKQDKGLDAIVTPCGGGGMLSGVALSQEGTGVKVFGAEPNHQGADDATRGYHTQERIRGVRTLTIADGLRTELGDVTYPLVCGRERGLVSGMYAVSEAEIRAALRLVLERMKVVVEPSAVVPLAAVLFNEEFRGMVEREAGPEGWDLGVVFSGGNISLEKVAELIAP